jgi:hypothetical protein
LNLSSPWRPGENVLSQQHIQVCFHHQHLIF